MESAEATLQNDYYDAYVDEQVEFAIRGKNNKNDAGATRFKRIPLHKITLESEIPEEPQEKHDKPNDSHYEKELKKIDDEINKHKENQTKLKDQIKEERTGNRPETKVLYDKVKEINEKLKPIDEKIKKLEKDSDDVVSKEKSLKEKRDKLEKEIDVKNYDKLMAEIRHYQEQLGFATLSAGEEKKIMDKKSRLETQVGATKKYQEVKDKLKNLRDSNKGVFDNLKVFRTERKVLLDERKKISEKIEESKKSVTANNQVIEQLKVQLDSIGHEIKALTKKYYEIEREWNEKWRKYEKYMEVVEYIREAKKKQNDIRKREEKLKKKEEKEAKKKGQTEETVEIVVQKSDETLETVTCSKLIEYFRSLLPKSEEKVETTGEAKVEVDGKIHEDIKKGNLEVYNRDAINNTQVLGVGGGPAKKKNKGPKVSKREQKSNATDMLLLSVGINSDIKLVGLTAPNKRDQVETFIKALEGRLVELKAEAKKAGDQPKTEDEKKEN